VEYGRLGRRTASDLPSKILHQHVRNRQVAPQRDPSTDSRGQGRRLFVGIRDDLTVAIGESIIKDTSID
jgi:hypothetical protein